MSKRVRSWSPSTGHSVGPLEKGTNEWLRRPQWPGAVLGKNIWGEGGELAPHMYRNTGLQMYYFEKWGAGQDLEGPVLPPALA